MQSHLPKLVVFVVPALAIGAAFACSSDPAPPADIPSASDSGSTPIEDAAAPTPDQNAPSEASTAGLVPDPTAPGRITQFDTDMAKAICDQLANCCNPADYEKYFAQFMQKPFDLAAAPAPAACATTLATTLGKLHQKWGAWAVRGSVRFDDAKGAACIASVKAATCGETSLNATLFDEKCQGVRRNEVFTKLTPLGTSCQTGDSTFYGDCDPNLGFCSDKKVCTAWRKTGESCGTYLQADASPEAGLTLLFCEPDHQCDNSTLRAPGKCTGPSIDSKLGDRCDALTGPLQVCTKGTYCGPTGTCEATKIDGASCQGDGECATLHTGTCAGPTFATRVCGGPVFCGGK